MSLRHDADPGAGKLDLGQVHDLLRLLADALQLPRGSQIAHYLVSGLARILDAELVGSVFDLACASAPFVDWNGAEATALDAFDARRACTPMLREFMQMAPSEPGTPITATYQQILHEGRVSMLEHVPLDLRALGVAHVLLSSVRLRASAEIHGLGLSRSPSQPSFRAEERNLVLVFHRACEPLLRPPVAAGTATSARDPRLSPRERQTLDLVLIGLSDKEIADRLGISRHTVNQYTKAIYRHYAVTSRPLLLARLLRSPHAASP